MYILNLSCWWQLQICKQSIRIYSLWFKNPSRPANTFFKVELLWKNALLFKIDIFQIVLLNNFYFWSERWPASFCHLYCVGQWFMAVCRCSTDSYPVSQDYVANVPLLLLIYQDWCNFDKVYTTGEICCSITPPQNMHSSSKKLLSVPKFILKTCGARVFSIWVPTLWNQLPNSIRHSAPLEAFKSRIKTLIFYLASILRLLLILLFLNFIYI